MWLKEIYGRVRVGKHLSDVLPVMYGLKKGDVFRHCFSTLL
jgi:hypothetical protein